MKNTWKRILSFAMVLMLVVSIAVPAFAAGKITPATGKVTTYLSGKKGGWTEIMLASGTKKFSFSRSSIVKVSKGTSGANLVMVSNSGNTYNREYKNNNSWNKEGSTNYQAFVQLWAQNAGTAAIKYKIGSKQYKVSVDILSYKNPVKSITMGGVKSGKNFASLTKTNSMVEKLAIKSASNSTLKVKAASGWKITNVRIQDYTTGRTVNVWDYDGMGSTNLYWGKLIPSHNYQIHLQFKNNSTGAYEYVNYYNR